MKSRIPPQFNKHQKQAMQDFIVSEITQGAEKKAERMTVRAQWLLIILFHDCLGIGEKRLNRALKAYTPLLQEYQECIDDDVADEKLARKVREIMPKTFEKWFDEENLRCRTEPKP